MKLLVFGFGQLLPVHIERRRLLGGQARPVPVYGSGGWLSYSDAELVDEVRGYVRRGFAAVKVKVGQLMAEIDQDIQKAKVDSNLARSGYPMVIPFISKTTTYRSTIQHSSPTFSLRPVPHPHGWENSCEHKES